MTVLDQSAEALLEGAEETLLTPQEFVGLEKITERDNLLLLATPDLKI